ncbi:hypothetical protein EME01_00200 [Sinorhizobium meliloti]|nr:hypothetical protein EME01_00200 [Sinorhizobium meliloti]
MTFRKAVQLLALGFLAMSSPAAQGAMKPSGAEMQKPPDYERAVRSEFEAVRAENTVQAYERFIRRHPGHHLVGDARKAISRLQGR